MVALAYVSVCRKNRANEVSEHISPLTWVIFSKTGLWRTDKSHEQENSPSKNIIYTAQDGGEHIIVPNGIGGWLMPPRLSASIQVFTPDNIRIRFNRQRHRVRQPPSPPVGDDAVG